MQVLFWSRLACKLAHAASKCSRQRGTDSLATAQALHKESPCHVAGVLHMKRPSAKAFVQSLYHTHAAAAALLLQPRCNLPTKQAHLGRPHGCRYAAGTRAGQLRVQRLLPGMLLGPVGMAGRWQWEAVQQGVRQKNADGTTDTCAAASSGSGGPPIRGQQWRPPAAHSASQPRQHAATTFGDTHC